MRKKLITFFLTFVMLFAMTSSAFAAANTNLTNLKLLSNGKTISSMTIAPTSNSQGGNDQGKPGGGGDQGKPGGGGDQGGNDQGKPGGGGDQGGNDQGKPGGGGDQGGNDQGKPGGGGDQGGDDQGKPGDGDDQGGDDKGKPGDGGDQGGNCGKDCTCDDDCDCDCDGDRCDCCDNGNGNGGGCECDDSCGCGNDCVCEPCECGDGCICECGDQCNCELCDCTDEKEEEKEENNNNNNNTTGGGGRGIVSNTTTINIPDGAIPLAFIADHIKYLYGYPDGDIRPDNNITRAEAAAIFHRLLANADKNGYADSSYSDVADDQWFNNSIAYLERYGVVQGYPDGTFRPDATITRAEYAAMASRFDQLAEATENSFTDVADDHWAINFINSASAKGWVNGFGEGLFKPEDKITRAQVVTIVNRMLERGITIENVPAEIIGTYFDLTTGHWAFCAIIEASYFHEYERNAENLEIWTSYYFAR